MSTRAAVGNLPLHGGVCTAQHGSPSSSFVIEKLAKDLTDPPSAMGRALLGCEILRELRMTMGVAGHQIGAGPVTRMTRDVAGRSTKTSDGEWRAEDRGTTGSRGSGADGLWPEAGVVEGEQSQGAASGNGLGAAGRPELAVDPAERVLGRLLRDHQPLG